ncbi:protein SpAN-like [Tubulanus polymorphus]|uniref:protein SpAN-like n=1 Tax=Tubulanus polymorphus TaxID=672921 RepID=UPI003DA49B05
MDALGFATVLVLSTLLHLSASELTKEQQENLLNQIRLDTNEDVVNVDGYKAEIANSMRYWHNGSETFVEVNEPGKYYIEQVDHGRNDIIVDAENSTSKIEQLNEEISKRKFTVEKNRLWKSGYIRFCFRPGQFTNDQKNKVRKATRTLMQHTCLRFQEHGNCDSNFDMITFVRDSSGRFDVLNYTIINLRQVGTAMHEIIHATGSWHEQSRSDRSAWVIVSKDEYIDPSQFDLEKTDDSVPFDYRSIMAYGGAGSRGRPAMYSLDPEMNFATGNGHTALTFYDQKQINHKYQCAGCGRVITINSGYQVIKSPNYPSNYGNGVTCAWIIKTPKNTIMTIRFLDLEIDGAPTGCKDSLEIRYQGLGNVGPRYCGSGIKKTLESTFNRVMFVLRSDQHRSQRRGFKIQVTVKKDYSCHPNPCLNGGKCSKTPYGLAMCTCPYLNMVGRWCDHAIGDWSSWGSWTSCSGRCGVQTRQRQCNNPLPKGRGLKCIGNNIEAKPCGSWPCQGYFICDFDKYSLGSTYCPVRQVRNTQEDKFDGVRQLITRIPTSQLVK